MIFDIEIDVVEFIVNQDTSFIILDLTKTSLLMKSDIEMFFSPFFGGDIFPKRELYFVAVPVDKRRGDYRLKYHP